MQALWFVNKTVAAATDAGHFLRFDRQKPMNVSAVASKSVLLPFNELLGCTGSWKSHSI
jgi:hypothetical protein